MDSTIHDMLLASDDAAIVVPGNNWAAFSTDELRQSVLAVHGRLRAELGLELERDGIPNSGPYFDSLEDRRTVAGNPRHVYSAFAVRFSNFGRLFTVYGDDAKEFAALPADQARRIAEEEGWSFVPAEALEEPYDGVYLSHRWPEWAWWDRYFSSA